MTTTKPSCPHCGETEMCVLTIHFVPAGTIDLVPIHRYSCCGTQVNPNRPMPEWVREEIGARP